MSVCKTCEHAGLKNAQKLYNIAEGLHSQCTGGCDCQHKVGNWFQRGAVPQNPGISGTPESVPIPTGKSVGWEQ